MTAPASYGRDFYDRLAPYYHLMFASWDASVRRQGAQLDAIIRAEWGASVRTVLDVAAGIGTQALALADLGYDVTASDRSVPALRRCRGEAGRRNLRLPILAADFRALPAVDRRFDVVLACDNALPHMLSDDALLTALAEYFRCAAPGGGCLISVRDYPEPPRVGAELHPYGVRVVDDTRIAIFQVWAWDGPYYDLAFCFMEDAGGPECVTRVFRTRYYAVPVRRLLALMREVGFVAVRRLDGAYFQPVLVGTRPPAAAGAQSGTIA